MVRLLLIALMAIASTSGYAQDQAPGGKPNVIGRYGPRLQISTIVYCGLAGAVLGLSTLSFYGRPQDRLNNIPIGFGVGVVIGTIYMTYQAAANPDEFYREARLEYQPSFANTELNVALASDLYFQRPQHQLGYSWTF